MPLSDNEKAATRLGWKLGLRCPTSSFAKEGSQIRICFACGAENVTIPHDILAPDMSDPRNYMKALEGLIARNLSMCIGYRWVIIHDRHGLNLAEADTNGNIGLAAMKALAALYDADHPEPDHGSV